MAVLEVLCGEAPPGLGVGLHWLGELHSELGHMEGRWAAVALAGPAPMLLTVDLPAGQRALYHLYPCCGRSAPSRRCGACRGVRPHRASGFPLQRAPLLEWLTLAGADPLEGELLLAMAACLGEVEPPEAGNGYRLDRGLRENWDLVGDSGLASLVPGRVAEE